MTRPWEKFPEYALLGLLALLWGSSYLFIKVAVAEIPPITLMAARVLIAALLLRSVMAFGRQSLPREWPVWKMLFIQSFFNSIGAWTLLAWGQQYVGAGLASVLNSTSPIFVFLITFAISRHESINLTKLFGVLLGLSGVVVLVGPAALTGLGEQLIAQLACLGGAVLYACAAIYGKRFHSVGALSTATGTMICASVVLIPLAVITEQPWTLRPSHDAIEATFILAVLCTGLALLLYFRLVRTLGSLGVASQAYLRAGVGVILGIVFLGETITAPMVAGLSAAIIGVAMMNWPTQRYL